MSDAEAFTPLWASAPGRTIATRLVELGMTTDDLTRSLSADRPFVDELLDGRQRITAEVAERLADTIGGSKAFWERRDSRYREGLMRVDVNRWLNELPVPDMTRFGWIEPSSDWSSKVQRCFDFFDVRDLDHWHSIYAEPLAQAQMRISAKLPIRLPAVAAWFRKATLEASGVKIGEFNRDALRALIPQLRSLTREKLPEVFLPRLKTAFADVGVAFALVRSIPGCPASGAVSFTTAEHAMLVVSGRFLSDDQFWFTVFHEIGHLVLHSKHTILDDPAGEDEPTSTEEREANLFAEDALLPPEARTLVPDGRLTYRDVVRIAHKAGVSPGIVVGQLQFDGRISYSQLNKAKRRYRWNGPTLESV